jgi:hypothetical protein
MRRLFARPARFYPRSERRPATTREVINVIKEMILAIT